MTVTLSNPAFVPGGLRFTASSDLGPPVWFHWWVDGEYFGQGPTVVLPVWEGQCPFDVADTTDADFDPYGDDAPDCYPGRRTIDWIRSIDADPAVAYYRVDQRAAGGDWEEVGTIDDPADVWEFRLQTTRLDDLTSYDFRVVPVSAAGNDGDPVAIASETIVRTPDAPGYSIEYDADTDAVTITEE